MTLADAVAAASALRRPASTTAKAYNDILLFLIPVGFPRVCDMLRGFPGGHSCVSSRLISDISFGCE